jgi:hypothetical protein
MLRLFLRQLSSSPLPSMIRNLWDKHQRSGSEPSTKELMGAIWDIIKRSEQDLFIVIDALDECPLSKRPQLLHHIIELCNKSDRKVHILATSRREPDIDSKLKEPPTIAMDIEGQFGEDIKIFVEAALCENEKLRRWDKDSKSQIMKKLTAVNETYVNYINEK